MSVPRFLRSRDRASAFAAALLPAVALQRIPVPEQRINALIGSTVADHRDAALTTTSGGEFTLLAYLENGSVYGQVRFGRQSTWQTTSALAGPSAGREPVTEFQMAQTDDSVQGVPTVLIASRTTNGSAISISLMNRDGLRTRGESAVIIPPDGIARRLRLATYRQQAALCFIGGNTDQTYCTFSADTGSGRWSKLRLMSTNTGALHTLATAVAYDHAGRLFVAWSEFSWYFPTGVSLATSPNNGVSFGSPTVLNGSARGGSELHLVIANDDSVTVAFRSSSDETWFYRTTDHGGSWQLNLSEVAWATDGNNSDFSLIPDIGGAGMLFVGTTYPNKLRVRRSNDNGATWGPVQILNSTTKTPDFGFEWYLGARVLAASAGAGRFLVAWTDLRAAVSLEGYDTRVYVRLSTDGGGTWGSELRVDDPGPEALSDPLLLASQRDGWDLIIGDGIDTNSRSEQLYHARITRAADATVTRPFQEPALSVPVRTEPYYVPPAATDNANLGLIAFSASVASAPPDIYVARSVDKGRTFKVPSRASSGTPGTRALIPDAIIAPSSSRAYLLYAHERYPATGSLRELRLVRSNDGGQTWDSANERVLTTNAFRHGPFSALVGSRSNPDYVAVWFQQHDYTGIVFTVEARVSTDGGLTFPSQSSFGPYFYASPYEQVARVQACTTEFGPTHVLTTLAAWLGAPVPGAPGTESIRTSVVPGSIAGTHPAIACRTNPVGIQRRGLLVYSDGGQIRFHRMPTNTLQWFPDSQVLSPPGAVCDRPQVTYLEYTGTALVTYSCQQPGGYAFYSTQSVNDGAFSAPLLIATTPWRDRPVNHTLLSDNPGRSAWMVTNHFPDGSLAVSLTRDAGASWQPLLRADEPPAGAFRNVPGAFSRGSGAAFPERALLSWAAPRLDQSSNALANIYDAFDADLDGTSYKDDIDDLDPTK